MLSLFGEMIHGMTTIRAWGYEQKFTDMVRARANDYTRPAYLFRAGSRWLGFRAESYASAVALLAGLFIIWNMDSIDAGQAGFAMTYALTLTEIVLWLIRYYSNMEMNMNSVERVKEYLEIEQEAPGIVEGKQPPAAWPTSGAIQVRNLVVRYTPNLPPVLNQLTFSVSPGEKVGVVGRTGAGKSTLSLALLRYVEPSGGTITIDGLDVCDMGLEDVRRCITIIPQDPLLFKGTVRANLDPFEEHEDMTLWEALRRAQLVDQSAMPSGSPSEANGFSSSSSSTMAAEEGGQSEQQGDTVVFKSLETAIAENGGNLSLGQRQLVALARALVRRSKVIIMDEATASVDFDTDAKIQQTIRSEFRDSTLLCIAHRLRTIVDYDRVLVLDKGRIVEYDRPINLLNRKDSIFHGMCQKSGEFDVLLQMAASKSV